MPPVAGYDSITITTGSGAENMRLDSQLLESAISSPDKQDIAIRFYRWAGSVLSIGRSQSPELTADIHYCAENEIEIVRRPTGGGAVLHLPDEISYTISARTDRFTRRGARLAARDIFESIHSAVSRGLTLAGVPGITLALASKTATGIEQVCYCRAGATEVTSFGKKLVGSAMRIHRGAFLQHGSIPFTSANDRTCRAIRLTPAGRVKTALALKNTSSISEIMPGMTQEETDELAMDICRKIAESIRSL